MNGKDLTPEQLQGLDAGLTQGGNPSVLNPPKVKTKPKPQTGTGRLSPKPPHGRRPSKKDTEPKYNPFGSGTANPENMSGSTGP